MSNRRAPLAARIQATQQAPHYQGYFEDYQWVEVMQGIIPDMESALELQVRKYLDRRAKDDRIVELLKAKFYLDLLIARKLSGERVVKVSDVQKILRERLGI